MTQPNPMPFEAVERPPLSPYRFGLLAAATVINDTDSARWPLHGVTYKALPCPAPGDYWNDPCRDPQPPPTPVTAFVVNLVKAAGSDDLVGTLTARDAGYGSTPVFVSVGGSVQGLATVGATATWPVTPGAAVQLIASIAPAGSLPRCDEVEDITVAPTDQAQNVTLTCIVSPAQQLPTKQFPRGMLDVSGAAFTIYGSANCFRQSGLSEADVLALARRALIAREQRAIEARFYDDELATATTTVLAPPTGTAWPLALGIGALEHAIAEQLGGLGVLHVPYQIGALVQSKALSPVTAAPPTETEAKLTPMAHRYAFGAGYRNVGPDGTAAPAGQVWAYATGPVVIRRTPVYAAIRDARERNELGALAERHVVITADCPRVAALITTTES